MCHERFGFLWRKHEVAPMWLQCHMYFLAGQYGLSSLQNTFPCRRVCVVEDGWLGAASENRLARMTGQRLCRGTPDTWAGGHLALCEAESCKLQGS